MTQLDNQFGISDEVTYGTRVTPATFVDINSEGIEPQQNNRVSAGLRKSQRVQRSDRVSVAAKGANGPVQMDVAAQGLAKFLKHLFGAAPTTSQPDAVNNPDVYEHSFVLGDGAALSFSAQVGRPGTAGTVKPFDYLGGKIADGTITQAIDAYATLDLTCDFQAEENNQTLVASPTYPSEINLFHDGHLTITVNGTEFDSKTSSLKIDRQLALDRFFQRASTLKKPPIVQALIQPTGSLMGEFEDDTTHDLFVAGTPVAIVFDWVGEIIAGGDDTLNYELKFTMPACRLDGPKPTTKGPGILDADTPFTVLYNGTDQPITALLRTTDATA
ncbi:MAG TPA: phage tail tube protein [Gaiellaceae bacterium]|nr:phage tail tube protein [Gaiellaceae bacterium]